jgi:carboxyl-terminal processing protease
MKRIIKNWWAPVLLAAVAAAVMHSELFTQGANDEIATYLFVRDYIEKNYVDSVTPDRLFYSAMHGMAHLDNPSGFFPPEEARKLMREITGNFIGIGLQYSTENGVIIIEEVFNGSPAMRADLRAKDRIVKVDGVSTAGWSDEIAQRTLKGPPGSTVVLTVKREGVDGLIDKTILRDQVNMASIWGAKIIDPAAGIGYIRLAKFHDSTVSEFDNAVLKLLSQGMRSLVLDLRFNGGGALDTALTISNRFIPDGVLLITKSRKNPEEIHYAKPDMATLGNIPLAVLVNGKSASASEVFASAVYDYHRGVIVGGRTFGKGSVQSVVPIPNSKAILKITTSRYYSPRGCTVQAGVKCLHKPPCPHAYDSKTEGDADEASKDAEENAGLGGLKPHKLVKLSNKDEDAVEKQLHEDSLDEERAARGQESNAKKPERIPDAALDKAVEILKNPVEYSKILDDARNADARPVYGAK